MGQVVGSFEIPITMEKDWATYDDKYAEAIVQIKLKVNTYNPEGGLVGEVLRFSVTDGYAHYIVVRESPLQLAFIDVDGGLTLSNKDILKLKLEDVQRMVDKRNQVNQRLRNYSNQHRLISY